MFLLFPVAEVLDVLYSIIELFSDIMTCRQLNSSRPTRYLALSLSAPTPFALGDET